MLPGLMVAKYTNENLSAGSDVLVKVKLKKENGKEFSNMFCP